MENFDLRQSPNFAGYMEKIGWRKEKIENLYIFIKKIPVLGNFIKILRPNSQIPLELIDKIADRYRAFAVQINYSPTKTLKLDLRPPLEKITEQMTKETRYEIRKAEKNHLEIVIKNQGKPANRGEPIQLGDLSDSFVDKFVSLWQKNALRRGFFIPFKREIKSIYEAFGEDAYLILVMQKDIKQGFAPEKILAGALIIIHDKTASYFHAASSPLGRQLSAPSLVVWKAINLAKEKGCRVFDFEGIYDERSPIKSWKGFTHFKKGFGGEEVEYPGTKTLYYNPFLKMLHR